MGNEKMELPQKKQKRNWIKFDINGKYGGVEKGKEYKGEWEFDEKKRVLKTNGLDGVENQRLISVTDNELILSVTRQGTELIIGFKKISYTN